MKKKFDKIANSSINNFKKILNKLVIDDDARRRCAPSRGIRFTKILKVALLNDLSIGFLIGETDSIENKLKDAFLRHKMIYVQSIRDSLKNNKLKVYDPFEELSKEIMIVIREKIEHFMVKNKMSNAEFGEASGTCAATLSSNFLRSHRQIDTCIRMASYLNIKVGELIGEV